MLRDTDLKGAGQEPSIVDRLEDDEVRSRLLPADEIVTFGARLLGHETVPLEEWIVIDDCPVQRDTEGRAKRAEHLFLLNPRHLEVAVAVMRRTGKQYKLDGHTRAYVWLNTLTGDGSGPTSDKVPEVVYVTYYEVEDMRSLKNLFDTYDQVKAVKHSSDIIFGALREEKLNLKTTWLSTGNFRYAADSATTLLSATRSTLGRGRDNSPETARKHIKLWMPELLWFDKVNPKRPRFPVNLMISAMWSFALYPDDLTKDFWTLYNANSGQKRIVEGETATEMDYVFLANQFVEKRKDEKTVGASHAKEVVKALLTLYLRHRERPRHFVRTFRPMSDGQFDDLRRDICKKKGLLRQFGWNQRRD